MTHWRRAVHRGLQTAGDAAVIEGELALGSVRRDDGGEIVVDPPVLAPLLEAPGSTHVVLAGTDRVAIDAIGVAILWLFGTTPEVSRGKVFEQEQIARAVELGLGVTSHKKDQVCHGGRRKRHLRFDDHAGAARIAASK
jgi:hypothetical protein